MRVIALVTQKGGTGKSSLVVSLAVAAQEAGTRSYPLDLDRQGTAESWFKRHEAESPEVAAIEPSRVPQAPLPLKSVIEEAIHQTLSPRFQEAACPSGLE